VDAFFYFLLVIAKSLISGCFVLEFQRRRFLNFTAAHVGLWCGGQARSVSLMAALRWVV
jgi:hypothetical protein